MGDGGNRSVLTQIQEAQAQRPAGAEAGGPQPELRFVLEVKAAIPGDALRAPVARLLPVTFVLEPMFPTAAGDAAGGDLGRFFLLRIPAVDFDQLQASPFELTYQLRDGLDLASCEPDVETEFYNGLESTDILNCQVVDKEEPKDRGWALRNARITQAWAWTQGQGIVIGQPDTGISEHIELEGVVRPDLGLNFIEEGSLPTDPLIKLNTWDNPGHGTSVASVAASRGTVVDAIPGQESGTGGPGRVTGAAPQAMVIPFRAIRSVMRVRQSSVAKAIEAATRAGCHVISMSLGGLPSLALHAALRVAVSSNVIVIAAAGNCVRMVVFPGRYDDCIAVGATNIDDRPWQGSCCGPSVDICAPGEFVWRARRNQSGDPTDGAGGGQGTSFATALTAGVAALWLARHGRDALIASLTPGESLQSRFRTLLKQTARRPAGDWDADNFGPGIIDAEALLQADPWAVRSAAEAMVAAPAPVRPSYEALVSDVAAEAIAPSAFEAADADPLGLSAADKERFGLEITWLLYEDRQASRRQPSAAEAMAPATSRKQPSSALEAATAAAGSPALKALAGQPEPAVTG